MWKLATSKPSRTHLSYYYNIYFNNDLSLCDFSIQIIEHFQCIGNKTDKERCLTRELFCEMKLCTVFPYGLNDKVRSAASVSQSHNKIHPGIPFHKHKREGYSQGHCKNQKISHHFNIYMNVMVWLTVV